MHCLSNDELTLQCLKRRCALSMRGDTWKDRTIGCSSSFLSYQERGQGFWMISYKIHCIADSLNCLLSGISVKGGK